MVVEAASEDGATWRLLVTELSPGSSIEASLDQFRAAAKRLFKAARELEAAARSLEQAAARGELLRLKTSIDRVSALHAQIGTEVQGLGTGWPLDEAAVDEVLSSRLMAEVAELLKKKEVSVHRYGSGWSVSPLFLRIDAKSRTLKIDRARTSTLRPSMIVEAVLAAQQRPSSQPDQFIETLYKAYHATVGSIALSEQPARLGSTIPLSEIYKCLTLYPESRRDYPIESFTRDVYVLDCSAIAATKDGQRMFLSASTSSRSGRGLLTVLDEAGAPHHYFAVAFRAGNS